MAIPPTKSLPPSRILIESTVGGGAKFPDSTESVKDATSSTPNTNPHILVVPWATYKQASVTIPALGAGATTTITGLLGIPELTSYAVLPGRFLNFIVSGGIFHSITGLVLQSIQPQGLCVTSGVQVGTTGAKLGGGQTYSQFSIKLIIVMYSVGATGGGTGTVWGTAVLADSPS